MRIIAGSHRGRRLKAPRGLTTRPTTDRVREALFSILGDLSQRRVLDCYAGTGALGLEALSRGAASALFIESGREAQKAILENARTLGLESRCTVLCCPVEKAHKSLRAAPPLDLILSDPPWPICQEAAVAVAKLTPAFVTKDVQLVLGHPTRAPVTLPEELGLALVDRRNWGDSGLSFYELRA